ncbi:hypothetical protein MRBLWH7_001264 [Microbacterium sp. LWH7-1.2]|uniref:hypothetical protein n=1 Tax=Microbacterium sp. LWH7-1.2 TaxID=3135257 RepID=UPI003139D3DA
MPADEPLHIPGYVFEPPTPDEPDAEPEGLPSIPRPVNWNTLTSDRAAFEWVELDRWVNWLRRTYGLGPSIIPPLWHRHPELVWELSALHLHWLCAYDEQQHGSAPLGWHQDFAAARERLHDWVAASGSRLDRDRATRQTAWPGEDPAPTIAEAPIQDRAADFRTFVVEDIARRRAVEYAFVADGVGRDQ